MSDVQEEMMAAEAQLRRKFPGIGLLLLAAEPNKVGFELHQVSGMTRASIITVLEAALLDIKEGRGDFEETRQ